MKEEKEALELYLHIPFCVKKCEYCDFLSFMAEDQKKKQYIDQMISEIKGKHLEQPQVSAIFIGGGTPSCLPEENISALMEAVNQAFAVRADAEITIEANPGTLTEKKLKTYCQSGINRLSMGLQSADSKELRLLGRIHTFEDFRENFILARKVGFENINVDLMSALPGQTPASWKETLKRVLDFEPEHISAYSLIIEEGTPFYETYGADARRREAGKECLFLPSEEAERQMYYDTADILSRAGYHRYEISNYARKGYACRHNCGYWRRTNYLGFGLGASSLMGKERFCNTSDLEQYLLGDFSKVNAEELSSREEMEEFMFLGLRLCEGIRKDAFAQNFGRTYEDVYGETTRKLAKEGLVYENKDQVSLTERGIDISNYVLAQFLL